MRALMSVGLLLLSTIPAAHAQYGPPAGGHRSQTVDGSDPRLRSPTIGREIDDVREQIHRGRESGTLTRRDGRRLRREASQIETLSERYGADGLSDSERAELDSRARVLRDVTNGQRLQRSPSPR